MALSRTLESPVSAVIFWLPAQKGVAAAGLCRSLAFSGAPLLNADNVGQAKDSSAGTFMLTLEQAERIAQAEISWRAEGGARVLSGSTMELPYGWVFFWNSATFLETRDRRFMLLGNAPLIVNRADGTTRFTGTARATAHYLREYEEDIGIRQPASALAIGLGVIRDFWLAAMGRRWTTKINPGPECACLSCRLAAISTRRIEQ
jgi:hypothetical protein